MNKNISSQMNAYEQIITQAFVSAQTKELEYVETQTITEPSHKIILFNDEVNTFDWVIESLMDICDHSLEQAEQSAFIVHTKGKYAVKHGSYKYLEPRCTALCERGLSAEIQEF